MNDGNYYKSSWGPSSDETIGVDECREYLYFSKDYSSLGGWLLFFVIAYSISVLYSIGQSFSVSSQLFSLGSQGLLGDSPLVPIWMSLSIVVLAAGIVPVIVLIILIIGKNPKFLLCFEIMSIINFVGVLAFIVVTRLLLGELIGIFQVFQSLCAFFIWISYFRMSLRVRVYIDSDAYLRKSIFFSRAEDPLLSSEEFDRAVQQYKNAKAVEKVAEIEKKEADKIPCPFCSVRIEKEAVFCQFCGGNVKEKEDEARHLIKQKVEGSGLNVLFEDESIMKTADMYRRSYGKSASVSYLKNKAKELGLGDIEITEEDLDFK